ncbi:hypothetical protein llap_5451 [Limosa lapponica baueri]|uniref:Uncharacterized protein n=1 Tax=Limosa lapponica baueri TaxID=1758121 RepID=A0A2I0UDX3_LIMLA|nr:hypothetical protein llap_5451 [Limosa lapponica baueri]
MRAEWLLEACQVVTCTRIRRGIRTFIRQRSRCAKQKQSQCNWIDEYIMGILSVQDHQNLMMSTTCERQDMKNEVYSECSSVTEAVCDSWAMAKVLCTPGLVLAAVSSALSHSWVPVAEQPQLSQPVFGGDVLQPSDHICSPNRHQLQQVHGTPAHSVFVLGIDLTQVQNLALGLIELHEVYAGPLLKPVKVPLDGIPSLQYVNRSTQLGVIGKLAEGALSSTIHVANKDVKWFCSQYRPPRNAACHCLPLGHRAIDHIPK